MPPRPPHSLRCCYAVEPIGIGERAPPLGWELDDPRPGAVQSGFRVVVASSPERLAGDDGDLWDFEARSGETRVVYGGVPLSSRQRAFWKVRGLDGEGEASPWSEPARFELGLLERSDWSAEWIAAPLMGGPKTSPVVPALRRSFELDRTVTRARLYVTALGLYEVELNGERVGDHELAPGWTDYRKRVRYQVFDVGELLAKGENAIGALLGDGWFSGFLGLVKLRENYGRRPALLAQLEVVHEDGSETQIVSDGSWRWQPSAILASDLMQGETVDARQDLGDWRQPGHDDESWQRVDVLPDPGIALDAMTGPPVRALRELRPAEPVRRTGGIFARRWIYDLGQNLVGRVRIRVRGREGTTVTLRHAEVLDRNGDLYTENLRDARATDVFTLRGDRGAETFEPRFTFHGFRYVEVSGWLEDGAIEELTGVVLHSDTPETGAFACSDPVVNQLQSNITWGQRGNFLDVPTDCPQRDERLGWTGDAQVFVRTACFNMEVAGFFRKWLRDLRDAQKGDGRVPPVAPALQLDRSPFVDGGPAWSDAVVICPWTLYRWYGDQAFLDEQWHSMCAFVDDLERRFPHGIRSDPEIDPWGGFGDWVALDGTDPRDSRIGGTPKELIGTAFFAHSARLLSQAAGVLGRPDAEKRYAELTARVRDAFRRRFVSPEGLVSGNTQTSRVLALHFDLLEEKERSVNLQALARNLQSRGGVQLTTGFVGTPYLLHVLTESGRLDLAYRLLLRREYPSWLYPIVAGGATTIWERWNGWTEEGGFYDPEMNSFNHYAYGSVGEWLYGTLTGLDLDPDPRSSGWRRARIAPRPPVHPGLPDEPLLRSARATLRSVNGPWRVAWEIAGGTFQLDASVPPNAQASVRLPDATIHEVAAGRHRFELELGAIRDAEAAGAGGSSWT